MAKPFKSVEDCRAQVHKLARERGISVTDAYKRAWAVSQDEGRQRHDVPLLIAAEALDMLDDKMKNDPGWLHGLSA